MKVCTDACLFGAVAAGDVQSSIKSVLDIGCGTGLLSLMLAQKSNANIDAIEIDRNAFAQASENVALSPWKGRINLIHADARVFTFDKKYDLIIANPPFFTNHLLSPENEINLARHNESMSFQNLIQIVFRLLSPQGRFAVLLPYQLSKSFVDMAAASGLHLTSNMSVKQTPDHDFFRSILQFGLKVPGCIHEKGLAIKEGGCYSPLFAFLLKDYYLSL